MNIDRLLIILVTAIAVCSIAQAGLFSLAEKNVEQIDAVFPELIYNTDSCLTDCSAQFKYCIDSDSDYELSFNIPEVTSFGYFTTESETHKENTDKCLKEETLTHKCTEEELHNDSECKDYDYTNCLEWEQRDMTTESQVWNEGLPSEKAGCYEVTIYGHKKAFESVDWQPTLVKKGFLWDTEYTQEKWQWWNTSWTYKKAINVSIPSGYTGTNFAFALNITYDADMQADFDDIRFTNASENEALNYWIENKSDSLWAYVWVNSSFMNITTTNQTIYMYYGSASATSSSNGTKVFTLFDDFNSATFNDTKVWGPASGTYSQSNGIMTLTGSTANIRTSFKADFGYSIRTLSKANATSSDTIMWYDVSSYYLYVTYGGTNWTGTLSSGTPTSHDSKVPLNTNYNIWEIKRINSSLAEFWLDNNNYGNSTGSVPSSIMPLCYRTYGASSYVLIEWNLIRKVVAGEPNVYFGAETSGDSIFYTTQSPLNNSIINNTQTIHFNATPQGTFATLSCNLSINGTLNQTNSTVYNNTLTDFSTSLAFGYYNWTMNCWNGSTSNSSTFNLLLNNTEAITINSFSPANLSVINNTLNPTITFTPTAKAVSPMNCTWALNETLATGYNETSYNNTATNIALSGLSFSYYNLSVNCTNNLSSTKTLYLFTLNNTEQISISAPNPANNSIMNDTLAFNYNFTPTWVTTAPNCTLKLNGTLYAYNETPYNNTLTNFALSGLSYSYYNTTINCTNSLNSTQRINFFTINDTIAPVTTASAVKNLGGAYTFGTVSNETINVTLSCADTGGIGCSVTRYCNDTTNTCNPTTVYSGVFVYSQSGTGYIRYNSNDTYGNQETNKSQTAILNLYSPTINSVLLNSTTNTSASNLNGWCNASDSDGDGLAYYWTTWKDDVFNNSGYNNNGSSSKLCYQETTNISTTCGGFNTGNYSWDGDWDTSSGNVSAIYDEDWDTIGYVHYGDSNLYINYTKPNFANANSLWQVKQDTRGTVNYTIPNSCWNYNNNKIIFKLTAKMTGLDSAYCYNGTWNEIIAESSTTSFYEEAMYWNITNYNQSTIQNIFTNSTPVADGNWTLQCTAFDGLTNSSAMNSSLLIDSIAPTTTSTATKYPSGDSYTFATISHETLNFTLYCDDLTGIGCAVTQYCIDSANTCVPNTTYVSPFGYTTAGLQYLRYRSNDTYNNTETTVSKNFTINHIPVVAQSLMNSTTNDSTAVIKAWCNATDSDLNTQTYYWQIWKNGVLNLTGSNGTYAQNIIRNLMTIGTADLTDGDIWMFNCIAYDGFENSTAVNSSVLGLNAYTYTTYTYANEKLAKTFWMNFTSPATSVLFYFDGTYYDMTNPSGNTWYYTYTMPAVATDTVYNYGYNWTMFGSSNLITLPITVLNTEITTNCTDRGTALIIDYLDEQNTSNNITENMSLEIIFTITFPDGTYEYVSFNSTGQTAICVNNDTNVSVLAQMVFYKTGYSQRTHYLGYLTSFYLSNSTQYLTLYTMNSTLATAITYTVYDWNSEPYKNAYLDIERFYTSNNSYQSVSVSKTDNDGQCTIFLEPYSAFYKAVVVKDSAIQYTDIQGAVISSSAKTIRLTQTTPTNIYSNSRSTAATYSYNNTTRILSTTALFNGATGTANLTVLKSGIMGDTVNCSEAGTGASVTLYCTLPNTTDASYKFSVTTNTSQGTWLLISDIIADYNTTYGTDALISVIMIVMSLTFFFMRTPEFAIVGNLLGLWICFGMGLFNTGALTGASMIGLTFAGIIVWVAIRK